MKPFGRCGEIMVAKRIKTKIIKRTIAPITKKLSGIAKYKGEKNDNELLIQALLKKYL